MISTLILLCMLGAEALGMGAWRGPMPPLAVLADRPYSVAASTVPVPLLVVSQAEITMIQDPRISAISPTEPLVTCKSPQYTMDATPAVRMELEEPLYVDGQRMMVPFPAFVTVVYQGLRMPIPVGAVIAPVPESRLQDPHLVTVVFAIPTAPLPISYPYYEPPTSYSYTEQWIQHPVPYYPEAPSPSYYSHPSSPTSYHPGPTPPQQPSYLSPANPAPPSYLAPRPQQPSNYFPSAQSPSPSYPVNNFLRPTQPQPPESKPGSPAVVTILDFPSAVASPQVLFYQPPLDDSELGNRGPPEAIVPAGIVQSTAPRPTLSVFLNAKESSVLSTLRDEAEKNKDNRVISNNIGVVEAL